MSLYEALNMMVLVTGIIAIIGNTSEILEKKSLSERIVFNFSIYIVNILVALAEINIIEFNIDISMIIIPTNIIYLYLLLKDIKIEKQ